MQKYRADRCEDQSDGSKHWFADWFGGLTLSKVSNCRIDGVAFRLTVYVTGEPDTWFSVPAATRRKGKYVKGYLTNDDAGTVFHAMDAYKPLLTE